MCLKIISEILFCLDSLNGEVKWTRVTTATYEDGLRNGRGSIILLLCL